MQVLFHKIFAIFQAVFSGAVFKAVFQGSLFSADYFQRPFFSG
jgi:hypothetical protein